MSDATELARAQMREANTRSKARRNRETQARDSRISYEFAGHSSQNDPLIAVDGDVVVPATQFSTGSLQSGERVAPFRTQNELIFRGRDSIDTPPRRRADIPPTPINLWWSQVWGGVANLQQFGTGDSFNWVTYPYGAEQATRLTRSDGQSAWIPGSSLCSAFSARLFDVTVPTLLDWQLNVNQDPKNLQNGISPYTGQPEPSYANRKTTINTSIFIYKIVEPSAPINQVTTLDELFQVFIDVGIISQDEVNRVNTINTDTTFQSFPIYSVEDFDRAVRIFPTRDDIKRLRYARLLGMPFDIFLRTTERVISVDQSALLQQGLSLSYALFFSCEIQSLNTSFNLTSTGIFCDGIIQDVQAGFGSGTNYSGELPADNTFLLSIQRPNNPVADLRYLEPGRYLIYQGFWQQTPGFRQITVLNPASGLYDGDYYQFNGESVLRTPAIFYDDLSYTKATMNWNFAFPPAPI